MQSERPPRFPHEDGFQLGGGHLDPSFGPNVPHPAGARMLLPLGLYFWSDFICGMWTGPRGSSRDLKQLSLYLAGL